LAEDAIKAAIKDFQEKRARRQGQAAGPPPPSESATTP
jgi:hypothetical protein